MTRLNRSTLSSLLLTVCLALSPSCASLTPSLPTPADAARAARRWPGITVAELERGRSLYVSRCSGCHQPLDPSGFTADDWPHKVAAMRDRAHLLPEEESLIVRYLTAVASRPRPNGVARH